MGDLGRWDSSVAGDRAIAQQLAELPFAFEVIDGLQLSKTASNVERLVIGPGGAYLVDSRNHTGRITLNKGTLWTGRHSLRREFEAATDAAKQIEEALGAPVMPVLCFAQAMLPEPRLTIDNVIVCDCESLNSILQESHCPLTPDEVHALRLGFVAPARQAETAIPIITPEMTAEMVGETNKTITISTTPPSARNSEPRLARLRIPERRDQRRTAMVVIVGLIVCAVAVAVAFQIKQKASTAITGGHKGGAVPFAPITATAPTTAAPIEIVASPPTITAYWGCLNKKGLGWSVVPLWPGDPKSTAAEGAHLRYQFSWLSGYGWIEWGTMSVPNEGIAPKGGLAPGSIFTIRAIAVSASGSKSAPSLTVVTAPTDPC